VARDPRSITARAARSLRAIARAAQRRSTLAAAAPTIIAGCDSTRDPARRLRSSARDPQRRCDRA
jgi:hypothetical protein